VGVVATWGRGDVGSWGRGDVENVENVGREGVAMWGVRACRSSYLLSPESLIGAGEPHDF
jgi:hypothetical protein